MLRCCHLERCSCRTPPTLVLTKSHLPAQIDRGMSHTSIPQMCRIRLAVRHWAHGEILPACNLSGKQAQIQAQEHTGIQDRIKTSSGKQAQILAQEHAGIQDRIKASSQAAKRPGAQAPRRPGAQAPRRTRQGALCQPPNRCFLTQEPRARGTEALGYRVSLTDRGREPALHI